MLFMLRREALGLSSTHIAVVSILDDVNHRRVYCRMLWRGVPAVRDQTRDKISRVMSMI